MRMHFQLFEHVLKAALSDALLEIQFPGTNITGTKFISPRAQKLYDEEKTLMKTRYRDILDRMNERRD